MAWRKLKRKRNEWTTYSFTPETRTVFTKRWVRDWRWLWLRKRLAWGMDVLGPGRSVTSAEQIEILDDQPRGSA
jgi:hypothetical protein